MRIRIFTLLLVGGFAALLLHAQTPQAALSGKVTSAEEGPMEGVLVSAKKDGSTITTTVVSDEQGRYRFSCRETAVGPLFVANPGRGVRPRRARPLLMSPWAVRRPRISRSSRRAILHRSFRTQNGFKVFPEQSRKRLQYAHAHTVTRWSELRARTTTLRN